MNKENKPCPFCGSIMIDIFANNPPFYVVCCNCGVFGPDVNTREEAWEKWNKRNGEDDKHNS